MKRLLLACFIFCVLTATAHRRAEAIVLPVDVTVAPISNLDLTLNALAGSTTGGVNVGVSGMASLTVDNVGVDALALTVDSGSLALGNGTLGLGLGPLGGVLAELVDIGVSMQSGPLVHVSSAGGVNIFDAVGTTLSLDSGMITYEATGYAGTLLPPGTFNFANDPLSLVVGPGSTIKLLEEVKDATSNNVSLVIPISISQSITTSPVDINAVLNVLIVATGIKVIPEPSAIVLLGIGVAGFFAVIRRHRRR